MKNKIPSIPPTPAIAYESAAGMARKLRMSLPAFCRAANVGHSAVYGWQTNKRTFDVLIFLRLTETYIRKIRAKARKAARAARSRL